MIANSLRHLKFEYTEKPGKNNREEKGGGGNFALHKFPLNYKIQAIKLRVGTKTVSV